MAFKEDDKQGATTQTEETRHLLHQLQDLAPKEIRDFYEEQHQKRPRTKASAIQVPWYIPAFTRQREVEVGRVAMLGVLGVFAGEVITRGGGVLPQLHNLTGLPNSTLAAVLSTFVIYNILAPLSPFSPTFTPENIKDISQRPAGPPQRPVSPLNLQSFFGVDKVFGFTKRNELFQGRLAMVAFGIAFLTELQTGLGPLAQFALRMGQLPTPAWYGYTTYSFILWSVIASGIAFTIGVPFETEGSDDIY